MELSEKLIEELDNLIYNDHDCTKFYNLVQPLLESGLDYGELYDYLDETAHICVCSGDCLFAIDCLDMMTGYCSEELSLRKYIIV